MCFISKEGEALYLQFLVKGCGKKVVSSLETRDESCVSREGGNLLLRGTVILVCINNLSMKAPKQVTYLFIFKYLFIIILILILQSQTCNKDRRPSFQTEGITQTLCPAENKISKTFQCAFDYN